MTGACVVCGGRAIKGSKICGRRACRDASSRRGRKLGRPHRRAAEEAMATALVCWICGEPARPDDPFTRDHVIPRSEGGTNDPDNYAPAHRSCNSRRGAESRRQKEAAC